MSLPIWPQIAHHATLSASQALQSSLSWGGMQIDPSQAPLGLSFAQVLGKDNTNPGRGALFRVVATLIRPESFPALSAPPVPASSSSSSAASTATNGAAWSDAAVVNEPQKADSIAATSQVRAIQQGQSRSEMPMSLRASH